MDSIGAYEAKTHFSELLERVENGETLTITRHGVPVARLVPVTGRPKRPLEQIKRELLELRKGKRLNGLKIKDMIREGRM